MLNTYPLSSGKLSKHCHSKLSEENLALKETKRDKERESCLAVDPDSTPGPQLPGYEVFHPSEAQNSLQLKDISTSDQFRTGIPQLGHSERSKGGRARSERWIR